MNRNTLLFALAAAAFCAVGAHAQDQAPSAGQAAPAAQTATQTKEQKQAAHKAAWQNGVKTDCAAEIATGGVCAGKDFDSGLEKCLHQNRAKLSDGCKATVHPHHGGAKAKKAAAPAAAPAEAPATTTPQQ